MADILDHHKTKILEKQKYKCANKPKSRINKLLDHTCPLWKKGSTMLEYYFMKFDQVVALCEDCYISYNGSDSDTEISTQNDTENIINPQVSDCLICFDRINTRIALINCGHTQFCTKCISKLESKKCPICLQEFDGYLRIYT